MNLVQMIASFLGILSAVLLAGYYYYLLSNLDVTERSLLPLKEKYYISLILPIISIFSMAMLGIAMYSSYTNNELFIFYVYTNLSIMTLALLTLTSVFVIKHPFNVKVTVNKKKYIIRHVIDGSLFTASPFNEKIKTVDKNKIYTFGISQLKQQPLKIFQEKNISKVEIFIRLALISIIFNSLINCLFYWLLQNHKIISLVVITLLTVTSVFIFYIYNPKFIK
ncbi:MAG: hypothetical protein Q4E15_09250 [Lactobacillus johnsonii]|nr:hypothetical protein [Lactobacillus johnsonii]